MPFIVSLVKYIIFFGCFVVLVGVGLLLIAVFDSQNPMAASVTPMALAWAAGFLVFLVLSLGGVATLISLHDRHREIAEGIHRIAEALESAAVQKGFEGPAS